jgi:hypothetical protein
MHAGMWAMPLLDLGRGVPTGMLIERHGLWGSPPVNWGLNMLDIPNRRKQSESAVVAVVISRSAEVSNGRCHCEKL